MLEEKNQHCFKKIESLAIAVTLIAHISYHSYISSHHSVENRQHENVHNETISSSLAAASIRSLSKGRNLLRVYSHTEPII